MSDAATGLGPKARLLIEVARRLAGPAIAFVITLARIVLGPVVEEDLLVPILLGDCPAPERIRRVKRLEELVELFP